MNKRLRVFVALLGLGMVALGAGCSRSVISRDTTSRWVEPPPATTLNITLVAPTGGSAADIQGTRVLVLYGTAIVRDTTLASVTTAPFSFEIGNLAGAGTYQVAVIKTGFVMQVHVATIVSSQIPLVRFGLKKIENSNTLEVVNTAGISQTAPTTVTIAQPPVNRDNLAGTASAQVTIPASSGLTNVSVSVQTAGEVPVSTRLTESVIMGVVIQANTTTTSGLVVNFPLPITLSERAQATGGTVNVLRYDMATMTWETLGQATIGADGTAAFTVNGLIDTNTILSIGTAPTIASQLSQAAPTTYLSPDQITRMLASGDTSATYPLNPAFSISKPAGGAEGEAAAKPSMIPPPVAGLDPAYWQMIAPIIAKMVPDLAQYIYTGDGNELVDLPEFQATMQSVRKQANFQFTYKFGGVTKLVKIVINYNHVNIIMVGHTSGTGG